MKQTVRFGLLICPACEAKMSVNPRYAWRTLRAHFRRHHPAVSMPFTLPYAG